jgi:hypothetical protein
MKNKGVLAALCLGLCLCLAGCGRNGAAAPRTNKNGTAAVTLPGSGFLGFPIEEKGETGNGRAAGGAGGPAGGGIDGGAGQALTLAGIQGENKRAVQVDPKYQANKGIVEIKEKMFLAQTNDVYLNPEEYLGKTLKLEGLFQTAYYDRGEPYHFVIRYGPGCCGNDGNAGFEVIWDENFLRNVSEALEMTYPDENEWVEAVGTLGAYEEDGYPYLCIALSSLRVMDERGAEFVSQ